MRVLQQPAFILHRRYYQERSLLLEVFSRDYGRLGVIAYGAAATRSRLKGLLQPFTPLSLSWNNRGELARLQDAEELGMPLVLLHSKVLAGLYVNELLVRLLPRHDPQSQLFTFYSALLSILTSTEPEEPALRRFEKQLLDELGYGLNLERTVDSGQPIIAEAHYCYVVEQGALASAPAAQGVPVSGRGLLALREDRLSDPALLQEVKRLMRAALAVQLSGRALKTRELYRTGRG